MNKTADIEWEIALVLDGGPLTLAEMEERLPPEIREEHVALGRRLQGARLASSAR